MAISSAVRRSFHGPAQRFRRRLPPGTSECFARSSARAGVLCAAATELLAMNRLKHVRQRLWRAWKTALLVGVLGVVLVVFEDATPLARFSYDLPFILRPRQLTQDAVIVYLDNESFRELGREADGTLGRQHLMRLVERCTHAGARLVFLDFPFDTSKEVDALFAAAILTNRSVILGATYNIGRSGGRIEDSVEPPVQPLRGSARAWGHLNLLVHPADHAARRLCAVLNDHPSAAWQAAAVLDAPAFRRPGTIREERWLRYYGRSSEAFESVSLHRALDPRETPDSFFHAKIVFVGTKSGTAATKDEVVDEFNTPWALLGEHRDSGVVIHATSLLNLLQGDWLERPSRLAEIVLVLLIGAGAALLAAWLWPRWHWPGAAGYWAVVLLISLAAPSLTGIWWNWAVPIAVQIPAAAALTVWFNLRQLGPKLVFISYRTEDGAPYARNMQLGLREHGINSWLDKSDLPPTDYRMEILHRIRCTPNYLLILTPGVIERAREAGSMLREEIQCAHVGLGWTEGSTSHRPPPSSPRRGPQLIIVSVEAPVIFWPSEDQAAAGPTQSEPIVQLAEALQIPQLRTFHAIKYTHEHFESMMDKLVAVVSSTADTRKSEDSG